MYNRLNEIATVSLICITGVGDGRDGHPLEEDLHHDEDETLGRGERIYAHMDNYVYVYTHIEI